MQPLLQWSWLTFLPLRLAERSPRPSLSAANGQLLAVRREAYDRAGGHAAVRDQVVEDVELLRAVKRTGGTGGVCDGTALATTRMYDDWASLVDGYGKSLWTLPLPTLAVMALLYVVPPIAALRGSRAGALGWAAGVAGRAVAARRTGGPRRPAPAAPALGRAPSAALAVRSRVLHRRGRADLEGARAVSRVVVVGAGVGGLAAAARLAALGHDVVVCEAAEEVGGKLGLVTTDVPGLGEFRFDTGPSLVTMPQVFHDLFEDTGGWPDGLELEPLDPVARYRFADGSRLDATSDLDELCRRWDALSPGAGDDWRAFTTRAARTWEASRVPFLESPLDGFRTMARLAAKQPRDIAAVAPLQSLRALGRRYLRDPRQRAFLDRYATYTGSDPRRAPAALAAVPYVEQHFGGWYVPGGLHRLGLGRARPRGRARRAGAHRHPRRAGARRAGPRRGRRARRRRAAGGRRRRRQRRRRLRLRHPRPRARRQPGGSRGRPRRWPASCCCSPSRGARRASRTTTCSSRPTTTRSSTPSSARPRAPCRTPRCTSARPTTRPSGPTAARRGSCSSTRRGTARGAGAVDWRADGLADAYADRLLDLLAQRGLDVRDRVRWSQALTPAELEDRTGAVGGAIYGTSSNGAAAAFLRPANRSPVPGLYLVGGSSHPGGGLPLVTLSARIVAGLVGPA